MKKTTYLIALLIALHAFTFAQYTSVPDGIFEQYLVTNGVDSEGTLDGQILTADANGYVGNINTSGLAIADFTGLEAFIATTGLNVSYNSSFTSLDLSSNVALTSISTEECSALNSINVSGLTLVTTMNFYGNDLSVLDVSTNVALETLNVRNNSLIDLDLSSNTLFTSLDSKNNALTGLDMRNGNNANVVAFNSDFNNTLTCIFVDDSGAAYLASWSKDALSLYANDQAECNTLSVENRDLIAFNLYPNPTVNEVFMSTNVQSSRVDIYNITGKLVLTRVLTYGNNTVNVSELSSGVYLARFISDGKTETKKLIIN